MHGHTYTLTNMCINSCPHFILPALLCKLGCSAACGPVKTMDLLRGASFAISLWEKVFLGTCASCEIVITGFGHYAKLASKLGILPGALVKKYIILTLFRSTNTKSGHVIAQEVKWGVIHGLGTGQLIGWLSCWNIYQREQSENFTLKSQLEEQAASHYQDHMLGWLAHI